MIAFIFSGLVKYPDRVGLKHEYLHELTWGFAPRAALARALVCGKLLHFDTNDGYPLKHGVDISVSPVNLFDWLNLLVVLRAHNFNGPFNLDDKLPRTSSNWGVFSLSFPTAVDRFITLWEMAGEVCTDPIIKEATDALRAGGHRVEAGAREIHETHKELLTLYELIGHRLFQFLIA